MNDWTRFLKVAAGSFIGLLLLAVVLIVVANPHRNIPFVSTDRPLMESNQRYMYASVARDLDFDSGVFGNSSVRFLPPAGLDRELDGKFAVLGMDAATPTEQYKLAKLFHETRAKANSPVKTVIHGVGEIWCKPEATYKAHVRAFPEWMYDNNSWNDLLYLFNRNVLEVTGRVLLFQTGLRDKVRFEKNGWGDALPSRANFNLERLHKRIYGSETPLPIEAVEPPVQVTAQERAAWAFGVHKVMPELLALSPAETRIIVMFVPYHIWNLPRPGSIEEVQLEECKKRIVAIAAERPNTMVLDFMWPSEIAKEDTNFWDPVHYGHETAAELAGMLGRAVRREAGDEANVTMLHDGLN